MGKQSDTSSAAAEIRVSARIMSAMLSHLIIPVTRRFVVVVATLASAVVAVDAGLPVAAQNASAPAPVILTPGPSAARMPTNADEFDAYFKKISNWGRWGASDELGTLNLITDAKRGRPRPSCAAVRPSASPIRRSRRAISTTAARSSTR